MKPFPYLPVFVFLVPMLWAGEEPKLTPRQALRPFNEVVGPWRGTGIPAGTKEEQQKNFWVEAMEWEWQFKGRDTWIQVKIDKGKHFTGGALRYLPEKKEFQFTLQTTAKEELTFIGQLAVNKDGTKVLTLDREKDKDAQRLIFTFLHPNRFLYRYEVRPADRKYFSRHYQVGVTREGVPFAMGDGRPECVVTGGLGTSSVSYMGKTYYVCCSGCRDEFNQNAARYVKEFEEKLAKRAKGQ